MPKVTYIAFDGTKSTIEVPVGENAMQGALYDGIDGIAGECGGAPSCATCHVYVDDAWTTRVGGPVDSAEAELLEAAACEVESNSRLSCQIVMTELLDGLVLHLPQSQY